MTLRVVRAIALVVFVLPACVVRLSERNAPLPNGGVTGVAADCSKVTPEPKGAPAGDAAIKFVGRFDMTDPAHPLFDWSGNYISARFTGTQVSVGIQTPNFNPDGTIKDPAVRVLSFTVVVDDRPPIKFLTELGRTVYPLVTGLDPNVPHQVVLHRNTEAQSGVAVFNGFDFGPNSQLLPPVQRARRIEVIGDSITAGYGDEGPNALCPFAVQVEEPDPEHPGKTIKVPTPVSENNYLAYMSIVGRTLDADVTTVCWSGKGVGLNYRENTCDFDRKVTVPQLWMQRTVASRALPSDPPRTGCDTLPCDCGNPDGTKAHYTEQPADPEPLRGPAWDFAKEAQPQVVVVNLGTNDFTRDQNFDNVPDGVDLPRFRQNYLDFLVELRKRRPDAHVFLAVPPMLTDQFPFDNARSQFRDTLRSVVEERNKSGDGKMYFIELVEMGLRYGLGCDYHPNLTVHQMMADQVAGAIRAKTCW